MQLHVAAVTLVDVGANVDVGATGKIKQVNVTISLLFCMTIWLEIWYMDVY